MSNFSRWQFGTALLTALGIAASTAAPTHAGTDIDWNELQNPNTQQPIVFLVNGFGGCNPCIAPALKEKLKAEGIPVYDLDWNDIHRRKQTTKFNLDDYEFLQQMDNVISQIDPSRQIVLVGHSFGADSVLKVAQRVAPRKIAFLGVLDGVGAGGVRTRLNVGSNVENFYNRWTVNGTWSIPRNAGSSGEVGCSASNGCDDQKEQSYGYDENGAAIRDECRADEFTCPGYNIKPKWLGGSNGTQHRRIHHGGDKAIYKDPYIQQQIFEKISSLPRTLVTKVKEIKPDCRRPREHSNIFQSNTGPILVENTTSSPISVSLYDASGNKQSEVTRISPQVPSWIPNNNNKLKANGDWAFQVGDGCLHYIGEEADFSENGSYFFLKYIGDQ